MGTKLADELLCRPGETQLVHLETGDDPGEADKAELDDLRALIR